MLLFSRNDGWDGGVSEVITTWSLYGIRRLKIISDLKAAENKN